MKRRKVQEKSGKVDISANTQEREYRSTLECKNCRTVALMLLMVVLMERLKAQTENIYQTNKQVSGFRKNKAAYTALRLVVEKARRKNKKIYNSFVDFKKHSTAPIRL